MSQPTPQVVAAFASVIASLYRDLEDPAQAHKAAILEAEIAVLHAGFHPRSVEAVTFNATPGTRADWTDLRRALMGRHPNYLPAGIVIHLPDGAWIETVPGVEMYEDQTSWILRRRPGVPERAGVFALPPSASYDEDNPWCEPAPIEADKAA